MMRRTWAPSSSSPVRFKYSQPLACRPALGRAALAPAWQACKHSCACTPRLQEPDSMPGMRRACLAALVHFLSAEQWTLRRVSGICACREAETGRG